MAYRVIYSKAGTECADTFGELDSAIADFDEKRRMDKEGYFDDRLVLHVANAADERVHP